MYGNPEGLTDASDSYSTHVIKTILFAQSSAMIQTLILITDQQNSIQQNYNKLSLTSLFACARCTKKSFLADLP